MTRKKLPIFSIALFVISGLLIIYSVWAIVNCYNYIEEAIASGQLTTSGSEYDIINFYMSNCAQYVFFALLFFAIGWIYFKPQAVVKETFAETPPVLLKQDDDLDEWFEEMNQSKTNQE